MSAKKKKKVTVRFSRSPGTVRSSPPLYHVADPIRVVLRILCGGAEPPKFVRGHGYSYFTDAQHSELQNWVGMHLHSDLTWSTAIGVIDAAESIVQEAISNANISEEEEDG